MTPDQQLEKLLSNLSKLIKYSLIEEETGTQMSSDINGYWVFWPDIEAILKQTFPDQNDR